ncbi:MAG: hypothetical protein B6A08_19800 [Sorangiineae bacterium NIC37A_2]|jgi:hypothetical protein|nr:MAG: hypothetical protein B6A08_19800 [Sorangiineae bacterium NIC37A_2]
MTRKEALLAGVLISLLAAVLGTGCSDEGGDAGSGGAAGAGGDAGDDEAKQEDEAKQDDVEAPASCAILADYVGQYTVSGPATGETHRGPSTADHERGSIKIGADYAIDFDTNIRFDSTDITACYDRTKQDFDRRVHISYGADDSAEVINLYLNDALEVVEIQFRHNNEGVNVRVAVD